MARIDDILSQLNAGYNQITDLIPYKYTFTDDPYYLMDEFELITNGNVAMGSALHRLSNGKLLWGGRTNIQDGGGINIRRFNSDYSLDETFTPPYCTSGNDNCFIRDIAEQSDGKLIVVGHFTDVDFSNQVNYIMRLNTDGTLDNTFNSGNAFDGNALCVKILSNDKIVVGGDFSGFDGNYSPYLVVLNSDGSFDVSFSNPEFDDTVHNLAVNSSDKVVAVGDFGNPSAKIVMINADGSVDNTFSVGSGLNDRGADALFDADGKVVVGGWFSQYDGTNVNQVIRLNTNGSLDNTFALDGALACSLDNPNSVNCLALQNNGKILIGGWFDTLNGNRQSKLLRVNTDGTKDTSFETGWGFNNDSDFYNGGRIQRIIVNNDGSILVTGNIQSYQLSPINAFAKLSSTGVLDKSVRILKYIKTIGIDDGSNDMYDGGNFINTNLTQTFDTIYHDNIVSENSIPNTHTTTFDTEAFYNELGDVEYHPLSDGEIADGTNYFGEGSYYFTNMYQGMFVLAALNVGIEEFSITGGLGSDSYTDLEVSEIEIAGNTYACFMKTNIESEGADPTVNHIILVPGSLDGLTHLYNNDGDDYDDDCIQGLTSRDHIYYLLPSTKNAQRLSFVDAQAIAEKFLEVIAPVADVRCVSVCKQQNKKGFNCQKTSDSCTCATWRFFYPNCTRANIAAGLCSGRGGAYVPAITVCNLKLF
jgi:hypothetical protein